ncbi:MULTISPECIES: phospholipase D family protein [unclassified Moraxella]|uniref:phospholipase D family protein n=1 Tax=unclassified Moraxella TaxID=2685852 RepID=UPI003AF5A339
MFRHLGLKDLALVALDSLVLNLLPLDLLAEDWFRWLTHLSWVYDYGLWIIIAIVSLIILLVGIANHRLPSLEGIKDSYFLHEQLGENNRLRQLLSRFEHQTDIDDTTPTSDNAQSDLSGIYAIYDGNEALNIRVLLAQLAENTLDLQYYMWHDDASGRLLFYEIWRAAERGVRVRLLLDDNNTVGIDPVLQTLDSHPNIEVRLFNPFMNRYFRIFGYLTALKRLNRRMHNKSFTVDNQACIFGGRNIGDEYFNINEKVNFADLDVLAIGEVVNDVSSDFDRYWNSHASFPLSLIVTKSLKPVDLSKLNNDEYQTQTASYRRALSDSDFLDNLSSGELEFLWVKVAFVSDPPTKALPDNLLQKNRMTRAEKHQFRQQRLENYQLMSRPYNTQELRDLNSKRPTDDDNLETNEDLHLIEQIASSLLSPQKSLTIVSPYFVPTKAWTKQLVALSERGIEVNILTNSLTANDVIAVHAGYMRYRLPLLMGNIRLFELKANRQTIEHSSANAQPSSEQATQQDSMQNVLKSPPTEDTSLGGQIYHRLTKRLHRHTDNQQDQASSHTKPHRHRHSRHYRRQHRERHRWINRSSSSLHAKTFSIDGEKLFVGSFNFDPRSASVNTEMGAIIHSPILAGQLDDTIENWQKELAYVVAVDNDKLLWQDYSSDPFKVFSDEPDSNWKQRLLVWLIGKLPIEDFL